MPGLEEFITLEEASRRYRISHDVLTQLVESGKMKAVRIDGRLAVPDRSAAIAAIKEQITNDDELVSVAEAGRRLGLNEAWSGMVQFSGEIC